MSTPEQVARQVVVHGLVQGVNFRYNCLREANRRGVNGWVRNNYDGTVEAVFEGSAEAVQSMVDWAHHGPSYASVERVDVTEVQPSGANDFQVRG